MPRDYWRKSDGRKSPTGDRKTGKPVGRPKKYNKDFLQKAKYLAWLKKNNQQITKELEISEDTFYRWLKEFPEFSDTIKMAREDLNKLAETCLWHRLQKREIKEHSIIETNGKITKKLVRKELEPDLQAAIFQLSKCDPRYMDKKEGNEDKGTLIEAIEDMKKPSEDKDSEN